MTTPTTDCSRRPFTKAERAAVAAKANGGCGICGCDLLEPDRFAVDHIRPLFLGGCNDMANLQAAHHRCNQMKSKRDLPGWTTPSKAVTSTRQRNTVYARAFPAPRSGDSIPCP